MIRIYDAAFASVTGKEHWHLETFWWINSAGKKGRWSRAEAYDYVKNHPKTVYVKEGKDQVLVYHQYHQSTGTKWIQTYADGVWKDNLTALAERHRRGLPNN